MISIEDKGVRNLVKDNSIITGGCIVSMLLDEKVNDYDIYFTNIDTAKAVAEYYLSKFRELNKEHEALVSPLEGCRITTTEDSVKIVVKSSGVVVEDREAEYTYFEQLEPGSLEQERFITEVATVLKESSKKGGVYRPVCITSNSITLSDKVQLITRFVGAPSKIHSTYDYIHATNYWESSTNKLTVTKEALEAILTKDLVYCGSEYPVCSLFRLRKFIQRGWKVTAGTILKIAFQVSELDLSDPYVLQDQLIGVDIAYFDDLINRIRKDLKDNPNHKIDGIYITQLIDSIF